MVPKHIHFHLEVSHNQCCNWCCQSNPIILYDGQREKFKPEQEKGRFCAKAQPEHNDVVATWGKVDNLLKSMYGDQASDIAYLMNPNIKKLHDSNSPLTQKNLEKLFSSASTLFKTAAFVKAFQSAQVKNRYLPENSQEAAKLSNIVVIQDDNTREDFDSDKIVKKILSFEYDKPVSKAMAKQVANWVILDLNEKRIKEISHEDLRNIVARNLKLTGSSIIPDKNITACLNLNVNNHQQGYV